MDKLILFNTATRNKLLNKRSSESKFGEHIKMLSCISNIYEQLKNLDVKHVIIGIPEDIGVFANYGNTGTSQTWDAFIKILINIQSNEFTKAKNVLILGHLDFTNELLQLSSLNQSKKKDINTARELVKTIDICVTHVIHQIVLAGKKPIIIGGGHNNAYGNIKGASLALNQPLNVINFDAHSDFRKAEGRHSGNGFSYAFAEGFLGNYFVFGLHENYTSNNLFKTLNNLENIKYNTFEAIEIRKELKFKNELEIAIHHVSDTYFGIEIDCDAIKNISSSAQTPSGFSVTKTRKFINFFARHEHATYLHICEAVTTKKTAHQIGKLITYLVTDFIKAS